MNYLKAIMEMRNTTAVELSKASGVSPHEIRRLMTGDYMLHARKDTQKRLADALNVTVRDLVNGSDETKEKIVYTEIKKAAENLASTIHRYYPEQVYVDVVLFTHEPSEDYSEIIGKDIDFYSIKATIADSDSRVHFPVVPFISESGCIVYGEDRIDKVVPFSEGKDNDSQGRT